MLVAVINNWRDLSTWLINDRTVLSELPSPSLRAGYQLKISLENDASGNVIGATYSVGNEEGSTPTSLTRSVSPQVDVAPEFVPLNSTSLGRTTLKRRCCIPAKDGHLLCFNPVEGNK